MDNGWVMPWDASHGLFGRSVWKEETLFSRAFDCAHRHARHDAQFYQLLDNDPAAVFWRFLLGVGIGARHVLLTLPAPEQSLIEWQNDTHATPFLGQTLGLLLVFAVSRIVLGAISLGQVMHSDRKYDSSTQVIDMVWRCVVGAGMLLTVVALLARQLIPESPLFLHEVEKPTESARTASELAGETHHNNSFIDTYSGSTSVSQITHGNLKHVLVMQI